MDSMGLLTRFELFLDSYLQVRYDELVIPIKEIYRHKIDVNLNRGDVWELARIDGFPATCLDWELYYNDDDYMENIRFTAVLVSKDGHFYLNFLGIGREVQQFVEIINENLKKGYKIDYRVGLYEIDHTDFNIFINFNAPPVLKFSIFRNTKFVLPPNERENDKMKTRIESIEQTEIRYRYMIHIIVTEEYREILNAMCSHSNAFYWRIYYNENSSSAFLKSLDFNPCFTINNESFRLFQEKIIKIRRDRPCGFLCGVKKEGDDWILFFKSHVDLSLRLYSKPGEQPISNSDDMTILSRIEAGMECVIHIIITERYSKMLEGMCGHADAFYWRIYYINDSQGIFTSLSYDFQLKIDKHQIQEFIRLYTEEVEFTASVIVCGIRQDYLHWFLFPQSENEIKLRLTQD